MLSILIPVYNFNVVELVREIYRQVTISGVNFEILAIDDCSDTKYKEENRVISEWPGVRYEELPANISRSGIRNKMAGMAAFPWLLFIDCDSQIIRSDFISAYLQYCVKEGVICGGRSYVENKPENPDHYLHWKYGRSREQRTAAIRNLRPWNSFMTNNFMVTKSVFDQVIFDESIDKYGHEDTFFGFELKRKGIPVLHIDNPLIHTGLETNAGFLKKTREGIENLDLLLHRKVEYKKDLASGIRLVKHFSFLKRTRIVVIYWLFYRGLKKMLFFNLMSLHPCLFVFDMIKLGILVEKERSHGNYGTLN